MAVAVVVLVLVQPQGQEEHEVQLTEVMVLRPVHQVLEVLGVLILVVVEVVLGHIKLGLEVLVVKE